MKARIIVAVVCVPLLFVVLFFLPTYAVAILVSLIAAISSYELLRATGSAAAVKRLYIYAAVPALIIPAAVLIGPGDIIFRAVFFLLLAVLFGDAVLTYGKEKSIKLSPLAAVLFGGAVIPYFLSAIVSLKLYENGRYFVLIPFIIAFVTDGGAYFTGVFFGKHRPFPYVSPKKTAEGCAGGIATVIAGMAVYGVILQYAGGIAVDFWALVLYGLVGGIVTELGDLAFSLIKREFGIKDYGNLLPGHGGMLDRFDSMIFAAPAVYFLVVLLPAF
jgi:phosphatidate cytidylyltransferase